MEPWTIPKGDNICNCPLSYIGQYCEIDVCAGYCLNGGTCTVEITNSPKCNCLKFMRTTWETYGVYNIFNIKEYIEHVEYRGSRCEREVVTQRKEKTTPIEEQCCDIGWDANEIGERIELYLEISKIVDLILLIFDIHHLCNRYQYTNSLFSKGL